MSLHIRIMSDPALMGKALYVVERQGDKKRILRFQASWEDYEPPQRSEPTWTIDTYAMKLTDGQDPLQVLSDALGEAGYVPKVAPLQELEAIKSHLADMQRLVFTSNIHRKGSHE